MLCHDWWATKVGLETALNGLDMDMPGHDGLMGYALVQAVKNGSIAEERINDYGSSNNDTVLFAWTRSRLSTYQFSFSKLMISKVDQQNHISFSRRRRISSYNNNILSRSYEPVYTISFTVSNIGSVDDPEVPQLYLGFPQEAAQPPKILRGFERVYVAADESKIVTLDLRQRDISYWNNIDQKWTVATGEYTVSISTSANNADIKLQGFFHI
jgi:beta-glucosidase